MKVANLTATRFLWPLVSSGLSLLCTQSGYADVLTVNGPGQPFFTTGPWSVSGGVAPFTVPFARLDSVSYSLYVAAEVQQRFTNASNFNLYQSVDGTAVVSVSSLGANVVSAFLAPHGFGVIPPHSSGNIAGFDTKTVTGPLPTSTAPGPFAVSANAGTGPSIQSLGSLQILYTYTPIGLTQADPILPTSVNGSVFTFTGVPTGRWFDPVTASSYRYDMLSGGDTFAGVLSLPTGFGTAMYVHANGNNYGPFSGGASVNLPANVRSVTVSGIEPPAPVGDPTGFPIKLGFNRSGVTFTATPLPSPGTCMLAGISALTLLERASRKRSSAAVP